MDVFYPVVWNRIRRDGIKLRGSLRTKRLRKKRRKHFNELYEKYRDEVWLERHGKTFMEWRNESRARRGQHHNHPHG